MILLAATVAILLIVIVVFAMVNPTARRVALRNVLRRRVDAILVVLGCAFGTAIIVSSLLVGDTLDASLRDRATERLGPIDVVVSSYDIEIAGAARDFLVMDPPKVADGVLAAVAAAATLVSPGEDSGKSAEKVIPSARLIEVYFDWAKEFDKGPSTTGLSGPTPGSGKVALGRDAADALGVGKGDSVEVYAYGQKLKLEVVRVLPRTGIAGYATEFEPQSLNAFVELGTIDDMMARNEDSEDARNPERLLFVSAKGGVFGGAERTPELISQLGDRLDELPGNEVDPVKQDLLTGAAEDGAEFEELFLSLGAFAILAGVALLVNILVMLSEERRRELGILRSMGLSRWGISGSFILEGAIYALVASALGVALGVGVARLIVLLAADAFSSTRPGGVDLRLGIEPSSLMIGFLAGFIVSVAVVAAASVWVGRMTVIEAIRGSSRCSQSRRQRPWIRVLAMLGVGVFVISSVLSIATSYDLGSLVTPPLAFVCLAVVVGASRQRWIVSVVAVVSMLWVILAFPLLDLDVDNTILFVVQGLVLTLAAIVLIGQHQARLGAVLQRMAGGAGPVLRLALSYPLDRRFRTGATLLAYSLIVFTLVFSLILSGTFSNQSEELAADEGGGYDVL
ncbi:MAG: FtsX-like permease family protein, partial [Rubrobacteraceae bacterium]